MKQQTVSPEFLQDKTDLINWITYIQEYFEWMDEYSISVQLEYLASHIDTNPTLIDTDLNHWRLEMVYLLKDHKIKPQHIVDAIPMLNKIRKDRKAMFEANSKTRNKAKKRIKKEALNET